MIIRPRRKAAGMEDDPISGHGLNTDSAREEASRFRPKNRHNSYSYHINEDNTRKSGYTRSLKFNSKLFLARVTRGTSDNRLEEKI